MTFNYGMPYMGSKNKIAEEIIRYLPPAEHFYDLFGGGGAMTHCALLSGKYKYVHYNEFEPLVYKGFKMAVNGEFKNENRWISHDDFHMLKTSDPYAALCFSFGYSMTSYMYSGIREEYKKAMFYSMMYEDNSYLNKILDTSYLWYTADNFIYRKKQLYNFLNAYATPEQKNLFGHLECIGALERLQSLNTLKDIQCTNLSYEEVPLQKDAVIYCDPPYIGRHEYKLKGFDHESFYKYCRTLENVYISEYNMPNDFKVLHEMYKPCSFSSSGTITSVEKLYTRSENEIQN